jgi:RimJ/RimL family protein N-acetyltransferase
MSDRQFTLRQAEDGDFDPWVDLYEAVASEGKWIGGELPIDWERMRLGFADRIGRGGDQAAFFLAETSGRLIGHLGIENSRGLAELGMMVAAGWRGEGVGSAMLEEAVQWAQQARAHKVVLQVWPHNEPALALYRKFGFVEEGRLRRHYRRGDGGLWDAIMMGLVLDDTSPGSPYDLR